MMGVGARERCYATVGADFERRRNARPGRKEGVSRRRESEHPLFHTERTNTAGKSPTLDNDRRGAGRN